MLQGEFIHDQEGNFFDNMIDVNEEFVRGTIFPMENEVFSESCPRLALFLAPLFLSNINQLFLDFIAVAVILLKAVSKILRVLCFLGCGFLLFLACGL